MQNAMCLLLVIYKAKETCGPDWDKLVTYQGLASHEAACTSLSEVLLQIVISQLLLTPAQLPMGVSWPVGRQAAQLREDAPHPEGKGEG